MHHLGIGFKCGSPSATKVPSLPALCFDPVASRLLCLASCSQLFHLHLDLGLCLSGVCHAHGLGQMDKTCWCPQLFDDPSISSAAQKPESGRLLRLVVSAWCCWKSMLSEAFGGAAVFYMAGGFTALSAFLFSGTSTFGGTSKLRKRAGSSQRLSISAFSVAAACLSVLAVGVGSLLVGTWLITAMSTDRI